MRSLSRHFLCLLQVTYFVARCISLFDRFRRRLLHANGQRFYVQLFHWHLQYLQRCCSNECDSRSRRNLYDSVNREQTAILEWNLFELLCRLNFRPKHRRSDRSIVRVIEHCVYTFYIYSMWSFHYIWERWGDLTNPERFLLKKTNKSIVWDSERIDYTHWFPPELHFRL